MRWLFGACAVLLLFDVVDTLLRLAGRGELRHAERAWEGWPGFYAIYGFVICALLVLISKGLRMILLRGEDYYDD